MTKKYSYNIGDIAKQDIKATEEFLVIDREATEDKKKQAKYNQLTVYDFYDNITDKLVKRTEKAFLEMQAVIKNTEVFSDEDKKKRKDYEAKRFEANKSDFYKALGVYLEDDIYDLLIKYRFPDNLPKYVEEVLSVIYDNGVISDKYRLMQNINKGIILRSVETKEEDIIKSETVLKQFYDINQAQEMVGGIVREAILKDEKKGIISAAEAIAKNLIRANITLNANETEERRKKAALEITPVYEEIKQGEIILREGDKVAQVHIDKLEALALKARHKINFMKGIANTFILLIVLLAFYFTVSNYKDEKKFNENKNFIFVSSLFLLFFLIIKLSIAIVDMLGTGSDIFSPQSLYYGIPVAAGAMLVSIFIGRNTGMMFSVLLACSVAIMLEGKLEIFIYFLVNSFCGVYWTREFKERRVFIKAGVKLAILNFFLIFFIDFYIGEIAGVKPLWDWVFAFCGGVSAGIVTSGFIP
ncbi:MAG: hypothetical protein JRJ49_11025, partial [Deltaproteobacteria bacterium]|nr:hypothetical protein [Deltaproteobacteria bacterium]